jgi:SAM-dependent methyltransferase
MEIGHMDGALTAARWDEEYRNQRYANEAPLPFVQTIIAVLEADRRAWNGRGLYVGCGNGRNYVPLVDAGLKLSGLDISAEALKRLTERRPTLRQRLICGDFRDFSTANQQFDYLIAIQVFQHGDEADVAAYFERAAKLLGPGGLFFLRVNSAATQVVRAHTVVERNASGGFTVRYEDGPKRGLLVHFYSRAELTDRREAAFEAVRELQEDVTVRAAPETGSWAQWETVWKRRRDT